MNLRKYGWLPGLILLIGVSACNRSLVPEQVAPERIEIDAALESAYPDSPTARQIARMIEPYREELSESMDEVIGRVPRALTSGKPESTLGNWLADLLYTEAIRYIDQPVNFAVQNSGGIRVNALPAGALTVRKIYELMPFDNQLVVVEIDYATLLVLLNHMAAAGGWPASRQLHYRITEAGTATDITLDGQPLAEDRIYRVALPDYIANGGSNSDFLVGKPQTSSGKMIRDLIILHLREAYEQGRSVTAELDDRVRNAVN